jgi:hypothetical protein
MNTKQIDRALYGPSLFEVTLGAVLSILLGAALAALFLILKPVVVAPELPKEEERVAGAVYFLQGRTDATRGKQWQAKRQRLAEGTPGEVAFTEEELNAWLAADAPKPATAPKKAAPAPKPGAKAPEPEVPEELVTAEPLNVRIRDGVFQVGLPASLNVVVTSLPVVVQARGGFEKSGESWSFRPSELYVGSLPLHRIPGVSEFAVRKFMRSGPFPEDTWKSVADLKVEDKQLKITLQ